MSRKTSIEELYNALGAIVTTATGRKWWREDSIQTRPKTPYATLLFGDIEGFEKQVVETIELDTPLETGEVFQQIPWGASYIDVKVDFWGSKTNNTAQQAATRFKQALYIEERFWDLWEICALSGGVRVIDLSTVFREDVEGRTEIKFRITANIAEPPPLDEVNIFDIDSQQVDVTHVQIDDQETEITVNVENDLEESS